MKMKTKFTFEHSGLLFALLPLTGILLTLNLACKKNTLSELAPNNPLNYTLKDEELIDSVYASDGRLVFTSLAEYNLFLNDIGTLNDSSLRVIEGEYNYTSLRESVNYDDSFLPEEDKVLGTIFNSHSIFQVEHWVLKLDGDTVYAVYDYLYNEDSEGCWTDESVIKVSENQDVWFETGLDNEDCNATNRSDQTVKDTFYLITATANNSNSYQYGFELKLKYNTSCFGLSHKYIIYGTFGCYYNGGFQSLASGGTYTLLPASPFSMKLNEYYATMDPRCKSCKTYQKTNELFIYRFDQTLYSSMRGLQYHKGKVKCDLTIGSNTKSTPFLTMESWHPSSCDCPTW